MKKFFLLKLFLLVNCACLANIDKYTPNVIDRIRKDACKLSDRRFVPCRPVIDYKFIFSTLCVTDKNNKGLIERLKQFRSTLKRFRNVTIGAFNNSIPLVHEPQLSSSSQNKRTKEISGRNCISISGSAENLNIGTMPAHAPQENLSQNQTSSENSDQYCVQVSDLVGSPDNSIVPATHESQENLQQNQASQEDSGSKNSSSAENVNISPMPVNEPKENLRQDNTAFLEKLKNGFMQIFAPKELSVEDFEEIFRPKELSVEEFEEIPRSEKLEDEFEEIHSDWSLESIKGLVCTYTDKSDYKAVKPTINLKNEIKAAFGGNAQVEELDFHFENARVCVDKNDNDHIAVQFTFVEKWNNIIAFLAINKKKWQATLKNLQYFQDTTYKQVINTIISDPKSGRVYYKMNSGIQRVECSSNHSLTHCKFLIQCIADSQKSHKKPDLWSDGLVKFLSSYFSSSSNKPISSKEQFEKSCSDCARCNKKIDWFKPYINSKNSCINKKRPCALFSLPDCNAIDHIAQTIALLQYCEDISSLRCKPDYVQKLGKITPDKLKQLIPATVWEVNTDSCFKCQDFFKQQVDKTYCNLNEAVSGLIDDFSVISSLRNKDGSYPTSPEQIAQKIENEYLKKYLKDYGYQNYEPAMFYTLLGYNSQGEFIAASSQDVAKKILAIRNQENLASGTNKSKFLREMDNQVRNSISKRFIDAYLKYKAGNELAFDNFILTKHQSKVIQENFDKILDMKKHIGDQQICFFIIGS